MPQYFPATGQRGLFVEPMTHICEHCRRGDNGSRSVRSAQPIPEIARSFTARARPRGFSGALSVWPLPVDNRAPLPPWAAAGWAGQAAFMHVIVPPPSRSPLHAYVMK